MNHALLLLSIIGLCAALLLSRPRKARAGEPPAGVGKDEAAPATAAIASLERQSALLQAGNDVALLLFSDDEDFDRTVWRVLARVGEATGACRADIWRNHGGGEAGLFSTRIHHWAAQSHIGTAVPRAGTVAYAEQLPSCEHILASGISINTQKSALSDDERAYLERHGFASALIVPVIFRSEFWGVIRLGASEASYSWAGGEEDLLRSVGILLAATMQR